MLAKVLSNTVIGIEAQEVIVEVDLGPGLPGFSIVGLPDPAVRESINRVKAAIKNCGFDFPSRKITVNLAPADIRKQGPSFDLPIALGILIASEQISPETVFDKVLLRSGPPRVGNRLGEPTCADSNKATRRLSG